MSVGQAHRQGRRVLAGIGGVHLMGRDPVRDAPRQAYGLRAARHRAVGQGVSGDGHDQPSPRERRPQPVEVVVPGQIGGLQRRTDLRADHPVVAGEGRGGGQKTLQLGPGRYGRGHVGLCLGPRGRRPGIRSLRGPAHSAHRSASGRRGITPQRVPDQSRNFEGPGR